MSFRDEVLDLLIKSAPGVLGVSLNGLGEGTRFKEDLNCKSLDIVRFTVVLEDEYECEVPFMALNRCQTLGDAADYVCKAMGMS